MNVPYFPTLLTVGIGISVIVIGGGYLLYKALLRSGMMRRFLN
ncbi:MAG: hypothetical protein ACYC9U_13215 [Nitrososphaerales archaeon]